jgi:RHS repeat-associated protein
VRKSSAGQILDYLYGADGSVADEFAIQTGYTGWATYYVYLNGQTLTQYKNNTLYFLHQDHLGSTRLMTSITGAIYDWMDFLPFGEQLAGDTGTRHKFTGQDRDSESAPTLQPLDGLDSFGARYYTSLNGRFMTPDPAGASATCLLNPQTQNRYAYVTNNPVNRTDPTGLCGDGDNSDCGPTIGISIPFGPGGGGGNPAPPTPHPVFGALSPLILLSNFTASAGKSCAERALNACVKAGGAVVAAAVAAEEVCVSACALAGPGFPECIASCAMALESFMDVAIGTCGVAAGIAYLRCKLSTH